MHRLYQARSPLPSINLPTTLSGQHSVLAGVDGGAAAGGDGEVPRGSGRGPGATARGWGGGSGADGGRRRGPQGVPQGRGPPRLCQADAASGDGGEGGVCVWPIQKWPVARVHFDE